ncbi:MAG: hypothetical protein OXE94_14910 [Aestuariivita sp.]|nr:hypothetical protein [Aestuariivita sp.]
MRYEHLSSHLDERGRRLFATLEATVLGHGGVSAVTKITGLARSTIRRGIQELDGSRPPAASVVRAVTRKPFLNDNRVSAKP